jgi:hypothetical protein
MEDDVRQQCAENDRQNSAGHTADKGGDDHGWIEGQIDALCRRSSEQRQSAYGAGGGG